MFCTSAMNKMPEKYKLKINKPLSEFYYNWNILHKNENCAI